METHKPSLSLIDRFLHAVEGAAPSDRFFLRILLAVAFVALTITLVSASQQHATSTATRGGSFTEGIIGTPRFVNPALALTRADQDMTTLIYQGLMTLSADGRLVTDAAESIEISEDGTVYTIKLRQDLAFHDGIPLTARDVAYTIQLIQNPDLKSPLRGNWTDVTVVEVDEYTLTVTLEEVYTPFIENFTLGIMPAHIWSDLPIEQLPFSQLNTEPIGSGPYQVKQAHRDSSGLIDSYTFSAFRGHHQDPNIDTLQFKFFQNETDLELALDEGLIDATAYLNLERVESYKQHGYQLIEEPLPRVFGVFFNQNRSPALLDKSAREALDEALDRELILASALYGHGVPIFGPTIFASSTVESFDGISASTTTEAADSRIASARATLEDADWFQTDNGSWEKDTADGTITLAVTLRTSNTPLFAALSEAIANQWRELGVKVTVEQFEQAGLVQSVIRPRDFEALLFGLDMSRSYDLYPFWHSSQQNDPGLNVAQYANVTVDDLLETARTQVTEADREQTLAEASDIIRDEQPALFLFQPTMTYLVAEHVMLSDMERIARPSDRFSTIATWHTESTSLWPLFQNR